MLWSQLIIVKCSDAGAPGNPAGYDRIERLTDNVELMSAATAARNIASAQALTALARVREHGSAWHSSLPSIAFTLTLNGAPRSA
jgi:hypothetical protein